MLSTSEELDKSTYETFIIIYGGYKDENKFILTLLPLGDVTTFPFFKLYALAIPVAKASVNKPVGTNLRTST